MLYMVVQVTFMPYHSSSIGLKQWKKTLRLLKFLFFIYKCAGILLTSTDLTSLIPRPRGRLGTRLIKILPNGC